MLASRAAADDVRVEDARFVANQLAGVGVETDNTLLLRLLLADLADEVNAVVLHDRRRASAVRRPPQEVVIALFGSGRRFPAGLSRADAVLFGPAPVRPFGRAGGRTNREDSTE
jgi:hypothetical protein